MSTSAAGGGQPFIPPEPSATPPSSTPQNKEKANKEAESKIYYRASHHHGKFTSGTVAKKEQAELHQEVRKGTILNESNKNFIAELRSKGLVTNNEKNADLILRNPKKHPPFVIFMDGEIDKVKFTNGSIFTLNAKDDYSSQVKKFEKTPSKEQIPLSVEQQNGKILTENPVIQSFVKQGKMAFFPTVVDGATVEKSWDSGKNIVLSPSSSTPNAIYVSIQGKTRGEKLIFKDNADLSAQISKLVSEDESLRKEQAVINENVRMLTYNPTIRDLVGQFKAAILDVNSSNTLEISTFQPSRSPNTIKLSVFDIRSKQTTNHEISFKNQRELTEKITPILDKNEAANAAFIKEQRDAQQAAAEEGKIFFTKVKAAINNDKELKDRIGIPEGCQVNSITTAGKWLYASYVAPGQTSPWFVEINATEKELKEWANRKI